jgi:hypothetical protein
MTIIDITEIENKDIPKQTPILEAMDVFVPKIPEGVSRRNGMVWLLTGSGGSGKTNVLLNFFKSNKLYRNKFDNIWLITPESSFNSVQKHPFASHDKVFHELTVGLLESIYNQLVEIKENGENEYSLIILDDLADMLKNKDIQTTLAKFVIKLRHLRVGMIFTLQSYYYLPKIIRKQVTYITMFKSKNFEEYFGIAKELIGLNKDDALKLYNYIFDANYNHLDIDLVENIFYKNFNKLIIKDSDDIIKNDLKK